MELLLCILAALNARCSENTKGQTALHESFEFEVDDNILSVYTYSLNRVIVSLNLLSMKAICRDTEKQSRLTE